MTFFPPVTLGERPNMPDSSEPETNRQYLIEAIEILTDPNSKLLVQREHLQALWRLHGVALAEIAQLRHVISVISGGGKPTVN